MARAGEVRTRITPKLAWLSALFIASSVHLPAEGFLVLAGQPRPPLRKLEIPAGTITRLDFILPALPPAGMECRYTLYAIGGPLVAPVASKVVKLEPRPAAKGNARIPVAMDIPSAAPGARYLFKAERVGGDRPELLAEVELRVVEQSALAAVQTAAAAGRIQVAGESPRLRAFFSAKQISLSEDATGVAGMVVFTEERPDDRTRLPELAAIVVVCDESTDAILTAVAKPMGRRWEVHASLPHFRQLTEAPEAEAEIADVIRFTDQLFVNPIETPSTP